MRRCGGGCRGLDAQFLEAVVGPCRAERHADGQRADAAGIVDGVVVGGGAPCVAGDVASGIVEEGAGCCCALLDVGKAVVRRGVGVAVDGAVFRFRQFNTM